MWYWHVAEGGRRGRPSEDGLGECVAVEVAQVAMLFEQGFVVDPCLFEPVHIATLPTCHDLAQKLVRSPE